MYSKRKTRRTRALIAGALLAGAMAIGAVADTTSAAQADVEEEAGSINVSADFGPMSMRSGIRW